MGGHSNLVHRIDSRTCQALFPWPREVSQSVDRCEAVGLNNIHCQDIFCQARVRLHAAFVFCDVVPLNGIGVFSLEQLVLFCLPFS